MDKFARVHTPGAYVHMRMEHLVVVVFCSIFTLLHIGEMNWLRFIAAFVVIDAIGYIPGTIVWHKQGGGVIPPIYHHMYNTAHSYVTAAIVVGLWAYAIDGVELAMMAFPIHLSGDRSIFGNVFKPISLPYEPQDVDRRLPNFDDVTNLNFVAGVGALGGADRHALESPDDLARYIDHPSGFLALNSKNHVFVVPGLEGLITYRCQGRHLVIFGGVHAPEANRAQLLDRFLSAADSCYRRVMAVQLRRSQTELFRERGFTVNQLGSSFTVPLRDYSLAGGKKMKLRNKIKRAEKAGLTVVEIGRDMPADAETQAQIDAISNAWLGAKGKKELDFMIGEIGPVQALARSGEEPGDEGAAGPKSLDSLRRIFVVKDAEDAPVGFITYVPVWGERPGYLHDLTRRMPGAPAGAMELCNWRAMEQMISDGVEYLHFGFTPFIVEDEEPDGSNRTMAKLVRLLRKHGAAVYPADSQASYKIKWGTEIIEPEHVAGRPLDLRAVFDLLMLTRSL